MSKHINAKVGLAYIEGQLDAVEQTKLELHLADCPACQAQMREHEAMYHLLKTTGQAFMPEPSLAPNWADVRAKSQKRVVLSNVFGGGVQWAVAGVAVLLVLVFVWQLQSAVPVFEPAAFGFATHTPEPAETVISNSAASTFPESLPPGAVATAPVATATLTAAPVPAIQPEMIHGEQVSAASVNGQGRAAFVVDGRLFVETAVLAKPYTAIADHVVPHTLAWSPDGQALFFFQQPDEVERPFVTYWRADSDQLTPLSELISRPLPETGFSHVYWAENGHEILLTSNGKRTPDSEWDSGVWLADLDSGKLTLIVEAISLTDAHWLSADTFMLALDCGEDCTILMAYDREQTLLWKAYADQPEWEAASDLFVYQPPMQRILHLNTYNHPQTVDVIDTEMGDISSVWTLPDEYRFVGTQPYIAPNGRLLIFQVLDEIEQILTQVLDFETGEAETAVYQDIAMQAAAWNPTGDLFSYAVLNPNDDASYVYLWHLANETKELIYTADAEPVQNFVWTDNGERLFFNGGNQALWQYDIVSEELHLVAGP